jgi:hypothetical protein
MLLSLPALTTKNLVTSHIVYVHHLEKGLAAIILVCANHMNISEVETSFNKGH